jgi:uncharacterized membrane protein
MDKFVVAVFPSEAKAYEGSRAMKVLQAEGSLGLYSMAIVTRAANGKTEVHNIAPELPFGTGLGAMVGGLAGLVGGVPTATAGLIGGGLIGSWTDLFNVGVDEDFADKVAAQLTPGKSAVVAEAEEEWVTPLDTQMEALGGTVLRQPRADFEVEQIRQEVAASEAELKELEAEYRRAREEDKARLQARIEAAKASLRAASARAEEKRERLQREAEAKAKALQEQRARAKAEARVKYDERIAKLRADYQRRADKLSAAMAALDEALTP